MEDDINIYEDLPSFGARDEENLIEKNRELLQRCASLECKNADLGEKLEALKKVKINLEVNLASLLKTARAEISRKDKMIADIREQLDDLAFRRGRCYDRHKKYYETNLRGRDFQETGRFPPPEESDVLDASPSVDDHYDKEEETERKYQPEGAAVTVFGERLHKRILEAEKRSRDKSKTSVDNNTNHSVIKIENGDNVARSVNDKENQSELFGTCFKEDDTGTNFRSKISSLGSADGIDSSKEKNNVAVRRRAESIDLHLRGRSTKRPIESRNCKKPKMSHYSGDERKEFGRSNKYTRWGQKDNHDYDRRWREKDDSYRKNGNIEKCPHDKDEYDNKYIRRGSDPRIGNKQNALASRSLLLSKEIDPNSRVATKFSDTVRTREYNDNREDDYRSSVPFKLSRSRSRDRDVRYDWAKTSEWRHGKRRRDWSRSSRRRGKFDRRRGAKDDDDDDDEKSSEFSRQLYDFGDKPRRKWDERDESKDYKFGRSKKEYDRLPRIHAINSSPNQSKSNSREKDSKSLERHGDFDFGINPSNRVELPKVPERRTASNTTDNVAGSDATSIKNIGLWSPEEGELVDHQCFEKPIDDSNPPDSNNLRIGSDDGTGDPPRFENGHTTRQLRRTSDRIESPENGSSTPRNLTCSSNNSSKDEKIENIEKFIESYNLEHVSIPIAARSDEVGKTTNDIQDILSSGINDEASTQDNTSNSFGQDRVANEKKTDELKSQENIRDNVEPTRLQRLLNERGNGINFAIDEYPKMSNATEKEGGRAMGDAEIEREVKLGKAVKPISRLRRENSENSKTTSVLQPLRSNYSRNRKCLTSISAASGDANVIFESEPTQSIVRDEKQYAHHSRDVTEECANALENSVDKGQDEPKGNGLWEPPERSSVNVESPESLNSGTSNLEGEKAIDSEDADAAAAAAAARIKGRDVSDKFIDSSDKETGESANDNKEERFVSRTIEMDKSITDSEERKLETQSIADGKWDCEWRAFRENGIAARDIAVRKENASTEIEPRPKIATSDTSNVPDTAEKNATVEKPRGEKDAKRRNAFKIGSTTMENRGTSHVGTNVDLALQSEESNANVASKTNAVSQLSRPERNLKAFKSSSRSKEEITRIMLVARRRKPIQLSDSPAAMTVIVRAHEASNGVSDVSTLEKNLVPRVDVSAADLASRERRQFAERAVTNGIERPERKKHRPSSSDSVSSTNRIDGKVEKFEIPAGLSYS